MGAVGQDKGREENLTSRGRGRVAPIPSSLASTHSLELTLDLLERDSLLRAVLAFLDRNQVLALKRFLFTVLLHDACATSYF